MASEGEFIKASKPKGKAGKTAIERSIKEATHHPVCLSQPTVYEALGGRRSEPAKKKSRLEKKARARLRRRTWTAESMHQFRLAMALFKGKIIPAVGS
jgi:hypothetical protein